MASTAARDARRARIRAESARVGAHVTGFAEGQALYDAWGSSLSDGQ